VPDVRWRPYLRRIELALLEAGRVAEHVWRPGEVHCFDATRSLEHRISDVLRAGLLSEGEGWLCEEHADHDDRLRCDVVWVVDPVDGTHEFLAGIPEWSISVGLVVRGAAVAGGVYNPATRELFLGSLDAGSTYNGEPVSCTRRTTLRDAIVLASRQEYQRGDWADFAEREFSIRPVGSVAYKLALISAGLADATWTLSPKHEWDVAGGIALVKASGGRAGLLGKLPLEFNSPQPRISGLMASGESLWQQVNELVAEVMPQSPLPTR